MSRQITTFYKGAEFVNRVSYATSGTGQALPYRTASIVREWCQPINFADGTAEVPVIFTFPTSTIAVLQAYVNVRVAEATGTTKTINVGTATADGGIPNAFLNGVSVSSTGIKTLANSQPITITPTGSPFTYTSAGSTVVAVTGGTVSLISIVRGGTTVATGATSGTFTLSDGDQLVVTYSVAPTMTGLPFNDPDMVSSSSSLALLAGKRLSWTPASANFANLDADICILYLVMDDTSLTQNTTIAMGPSD